MTAWLAIIAPAWIAGSILALLSAPLGCLVLWRRMAFFADALAHGTLLGVALAVLWQLPMGIGIGIVSILVLHVNNANGVGTRILLIWIPTLIFCLLALR